MSDIVIRFACRTDVGKLRDHQEDSLLWHDPGDDLEVLQRKGRLYVVADGMGGHAGGEVASGLAVQTIVERYRTDSSTDIVAALLQAIYAANAVIYRQAQSGKTPGMGTTVVCAVLQERKLYVAHVGDSRIYLLRGNELRQITEDHTVVNELVQRGQMTADQAAESPRRHILSRALGIMPSVLVDSQGPIPLEAGDVVMLCTDGVSGQVTDQQIEQQMRLGLKDPQAAADALIEHANAAGGRDNATVIVLHIEEVVPADELPPVTPPQQPTAVQHRRGLRLPGATASLLLAVGLLAGCTLGYLAHSPIFRSIMPPAPAPPTHTPQTAVTQVVITVAPTGTPTASPTPSSTPTPAYTRIPSATSTFMRATPQTYPQ